MSSVEADDPLLLLSAPARWNQTVGASLCMLDRHCAATGLISGIYFFLKNHTFLQPASVWHLNIHSLLFPVGLFPPASSCVTKYKLATKYFIQMKKKKKNHKYIGTHNSLSCTLCLEVLQILNVLLTEPVLKTGILIY